MGLKEILLGTSAEAEKRSDPAFTPPYYSISDPALAAYFIDLGLTGTTTDVSEIRVLGIPGYYRAINVVAGTIAGLPLKTYSDGGGSRRQVKSFLDNPAGPYPLTPFAWKELVMIHLLNQGEVFLIHIYNNAGQIIGLWPIHRYAVESVKWNGYDKIFRVMMNDGTTQEFGSDEMTQIMAMTTDGLRGIAPLTLFRNSFKLGLAAEVAASRFMNKGMMISGLVVPDEDISEEDAKVIKQGLMNKVAGAENAGDIAVINRVMKFQPWQMNMADAQFLESREFQVIEFARMIGVPPHLVGATEKQTSWGTGVAEQNAGLAKYTLKSWTSRLEEGLSTLLPQSRFVEFDYKGLLQGTPKEEIELLIEQVQAGLLTKDEAREIMNRPPLPKEPAMPMPNGEGGDSNNQPSNS